MGETRDFLKKYTAPAHRALDATPMVAGLVAGTLSVKEYHEMLGGYHDFFSVWESRMRAEWASLVTRLGDFRFKKTTWLEEDFTTLGEKTPAPKLASPSLPQSLPELAGCLYVIEGSTLGGMHLSRSGHGLPRNAGCFFKGYGENTVPAWQSFIDWLENEVQTPDARQQAAESAIAIFEWFGRRFS